MKNHNSYKFVGFFLVLFLFATSLTFAQESHTNKTDVIKKASVTKSVDTAKKSCSNKNYTSSTCPYAKAKHTKMTSKNNCGADCKVKHGSNMKAKQMKTNAAGKVKMTQTMQNGHKCNDQCKNGCTAKS